LWATGSNVNGEVGQGDFSPYPFWTRINSVSTTITDIKCGDANAAYLDSNNDLWMWGSNVHGGIGLPFNVLNRTIPTLQTWITSQSIGKVIMGYGYTVISFQNGSTYGMGYGPGLIGQPTDDNLPTRLPLVSGWTDLYTVDSSTFVLYGSSCWAYGSNWNGALGFADGNNRATSSFLTNDVYAAGNGISFGFILKSNEFYWRGGSTNNWNAPASWAFGTRSKAVVPFRTPVPTKDEVYVNDQGTYTLTISDTLVFVKNFTLLSIGGPGSFPTVVFQSTAIIKSLMVAVGATIIFNNPVTFTGPITNSGNVIFNSNVIFLGVAGTGAYEFHNSIVSGQHLSLNMVPVIIQNTIFNTSLLLGFSTATVLGPCTFNEDITISNTQVAMSSTILYVKQSISLNNISSSSFGSGSTMEL
jgi:hypothetical protein